MAHTENLMVYQERLAQEKTDYLRWTERHLNNRETVKHRMEQTNSKPFPWLPDFRMNRDAIY